MPLANLENNLQLNYQWVNETADGHTILFLHEALGSIPQWKDFPELLCEATNTKGLIYERQGYGTSSPLNKKRTREYLHDYALKELPAFLKAIGQSEPLVLFGHSDGGSIALLFASVYPHLVKALIVEAAHIFVEPETLKGIQPAKKLYTSTSFKRKLEKYHADKTDDVFYSWYNTWLSAEFKHWNIETHLSSIKAPIVVLQGSEDEYGTLKQVNSIIDQVASVQKSQHIIGKCGHVPHLKAKEEVVRLSEDFLRTIK
ncbi:MAG: alpha/beta hydrolase [Crocinitomicaceae bacterium]|nr:alpha/beta hydrolase [Crocinitomicaceae bacterium]|tara:strand:+ start:1124 stop:1897 length:774 start_codon:yes stop_codon:yes gene_type:complete